MTPVPGDVELEPIGAGRDGLGVVDTEAAAGWPGHGALVDSRAAERFRGDVEPVDPRAGHVPGALSVPTAGNLGPDRTFLEPAALAERYREAGVDLGGDVAVYCGSGVTAAHAALALTLAGARPALWPGSWSAWSSDPARPVAVGDTSAAEPR